MEIAIDSEQQLALRTPTSLVFISNEPHLETGAAKKDFMLVSGPRDSVSEGPCLANGAIDRLFRPDNLISVA